MSRVYKSRDCQVEKKMENNLGLRVAAEGFEDAIV